MKRYATARLLGCVGHAGQTQYDADKGDRIEWDGSPWVTLHSAKAEAPWHMPCGVVALGAEAGSDPERHWPGQVGGRMGRGLLGGDGGLAEPLTEASLADVDLDGQAILTKAFGPAPVEPKPKRGKR